MLEWLREILFRTHEDSELYFHPGVNAILGSNRAGKSNILRGFVWLIKNRPLGLRMRSRFAGRGEYTSVAAKFSNTSEIEYRRRKSGMSEYEIGVDKDDTFSGVAKGVPDRILDLLNLSDINIQEQLSTPFLVTATDGEVAKVINRVIHLEKIEVWNSKLTTRVNTTNEDITKDEKSLAEKQEALKEYATLDKAELKIRRIEQWEKDLSEVQTALQALGPAIAKHLVMFDSLQEVKDWVGSLRPLVEDAKGVKEELDGVLTLQHSVNAAISKWYSIEERKLEVERFVACKKEVLAVRVLVKEREALRKQGEELNSAISSYQNKDEEIIVLRENRDNAEFDLRQTMEDIGRCPLCTSEIDDEKIEAVIQRLSR